MWYVSIVSIIFDCFMPILYNFHILLATFYMIYWTNLLIQCPVPVLVFCMFFVSQNIHIKRSPNAVKIYGELFWNICDFWDLESTQMGPTATTRHLGQPRRVVVGCGHCGPPFALIPPPKNHKYSKIILRKFFSRLDFVWYGFSAKQKTCNKQELALGTGSIG
jgi:hypothetical protein